MLGARLGPEDRSVQMVGRYALFDEVGHGGMATVHIGRLVGPAGFSKTVAIKRMHANVAKDTEIAAMFLDEARIAGRIRHPNVVVALDVMSAGDDAFLVMEYVHGESLAELCRAVRARGERVPAPIAVHILRDVLHGLHAAHETQDEIGQPLDLVHRDVSPQNILVGVDGVARVADFGIAKAAGRLQHTHTGQVKGKISYMAPEQLLGHPIDRRVDVFAAGMVLWETIAGRRPFAAESSGQAVYQVVSHDVPSLKLVVPEISESFDAAVTKATARDPARRFSTALAFARELEQVTQLIPPREVGEWVVAVGGARLFERSQRIREIEAISMTGGSPVWRGVRVRSHSGHRKAGPDEMTEREQLSDDRFSRRSRVSRLRVGIAVAALGSVAAALTLWLARSRPTPPSQGTEPALSHTQAPNLDTVGPNAHPPDGIDLQSSTEATADRIGAGKSEMEPQRQRGAARAKIAGPKAPQPTTTSQPTPTSRRPEDLFSRE